MPVTWQGRDELGRLIDVTADTADDNNALRISPQAVEAGGSIDATDGQIVFMDGTDAVGSADLTLETAGGNPTMRLSGTENGVATIIGGATGVQVIIQAANGDATHVGGELTLQSGGSAGWSGGQINIQAGNDGSGGDGGPVVIYSGHAVAGASGDIDIRAGGTNVALTGGNVTITGGTATANAGGDVLIQSGDGPTPGTVQLYSGDGNHSLELGNAGFMFIGGVIVFDGLPTADPTNAGQLWSDGGTLKVSAG